MRKPGDIVLTWGNGKFSKFIITGNLWTKWFQEDNASKFSHVAVMISDNRLIEATVDKEGVSEKDFHYKENYIIARKKDLTSADVSKIVAYLESKKDTQYSWYLIIVLTLLKILRLEWLIDGTRYSGTVCSVLVAKAFDKMGYRFKEEALDFIDPCDIATCVYENPDEWEIIETH